MASVFILGPGLDSFSFETGSGFYQCNPGLIIAQILFSRFVRGPGPNFIYFVSGSRFCPCSPGPDITNGESGFESGFHSGPDPDFIHF